MDREIKEDPTIVWPAFYFLTAIVVVFILVTGATSIPRLHDWRPFAFLVAVSIFTVWFVRFCLRTSLQMAKARTKKWLLADEGLVRLYDSGGRETIRWEQIRDMRWGKHLGLKVSWEQIRNGQRSPEFREEFRNRQAGRYWCWIRVREDEAREIFKCAKRDWFDMGL